MVIFGVPLKELVEAQKASGEFELNIPHFVKAAIFILREKNGLKIPLFFMKNGSRENCQQIRDSVDLGQSIDLRDYEVLSIGDALKEFLQCLPEPLIPYSFFEKFVGTSSITQKDTLLTTLRKLIHELPSYNRDMLAEIFALLADISSNSEINSMTSDNLSLIFGSLVLRQSPKIIPENNEDQTAKIVKTTKNLITYAYKIFDIYLNEEEEKKVRVGKKSAETYVSRVQFLFSKHDEVELSGLGISINTVVQCSEILKRRSFAVIKKTETSLINGDMNKVCKIRIVLTRTPEFLAFQEQLNKEASAEIEAQN